MWIETLELPQVHVNNVLFFQVFFGMDCKENNNEKQKLNYALFSYEHGSRINSEKYNVHDAIVQAEQN